jgi:hypothetical protein
MTQDNQSMVKTDVSTKQKVMVAVVIIIFLVVIWQVIAILGIGKSSPAAIAPAVKTNTANATKAGAMSSPSNASNGNPTAVVQQSYDMTIRDNGELLKLAKDNQEKYLRAINDLQILKLQREIAEANQAIASAKLATVTAEKSMSEVLTKSTTVPQLSPASYANGLIAPGLADINNPPMTGPVKQANTNSDYQVLSVSMQNRKWTAVVGAQGKLFDVAIGDVLTADGSVVVSINRDAVVLEKEYTARD